MEINRKRVARRIASGLVAGALALGGLAISGAAPASAGTAVENRVGGVDRYDTAVQFAREMASSAALTALTIVNGEDDHMADALGAASLGNAILLVNGSGIPASVQNFLSNTTYVSKAADIRIIGGESAVPASVETELVAMGFTATKVKRTQGDTRYETAIAVSELITLAASDEPIIVAGANDNLVDGVMASTWAAKTGFPVLLAGPAGLNEATMARLKTIMVTTGKATADKIHIVGGTSAVPSLVEEQLVSTAVGAKASQISRLAGATRYDTASKVTDKIQTAMSNTTDFALVSGTKLADALSAGPYLADKTYAPVMTASDELSSQAATQIAAAASSDSTNVRALGGTAAIPSTVLTAASKADALTITPTVAAPTGGVSKSVVFTFANNALVTDDSANDLADLDCSGTGTANHDFKTSWFTINGALLTDFAGADIDTATSAGADCVVTIKRTTAFATGDKIKFLGIAEDATNGSADISLGAAETTAVADTTAPTITVMADVKANSVSKTFHFKWSETLDSTSPNDFDVADVKIFTKTDFATNGASGTNLCTAANSAINAAATDQTWKSFECDDGTDGGTFTALAAGDVIHVPANVVKDLSGNSNAAFTYVVADLGAPTLSLTSVTTTQDTAPTWSITTADSSGSAGAITLTGVAKSAIDGYDALGWRVTLENVAVAIPSASADSATKRILISADFTKHDADDIVWAVTESATASVLVTASTSDNTDKLSGYISGDTIAPTNGDKDVVIVFTSDVPLEKAATSVDLDVVALCGTDPSPGASASAGAAAAGFAVTETTLTVTCGTDGSSARPVGTYGIVGVQALEGAATAATYTVDVA